MISCIRCDAMFEPGLYPGALLLVPDRDHYINIHGNVFLKANLCEQCGHDVLAECRAKKITPPPEG